MDRSSRNSLSCYLFEAIEVIWSQPVAMDFFFAMTTPGLEYLAAEEIKGVLDQLSESVMAPFEPQVEENFLSGQVFFACSNLISPLEIVARVNTVERICAAIGVLCDVPLTLEEGNEALYHWAYHWDGGRFQRACSLWNKTRAIVHPPEEGKASKDTSLVFDFTPRSPPCMCETCKVDTKDRHFEVIKPLCRSWGQIQSTIDTEDEMEAVFDHDPALPRPPPLPKRRRSLSDRFGAAELITSGEQVLEGIPEGCHRPSFRVTCQRDSPIKHPFNSVQIAHQLGGGIWTRYEWPASMNDYDIHVWGHLYHDTLLLGISLTPEPIHLHHRSRISFGKTSLKPSVAACICRFAKIQPFEVVLDPMCGSGTLPIESSILFPGCLALGGDYNSEAMEQSKLNVGHAYLDSSLHHRTFGAFSSVEAQQLSKKIRRVDVIRWDVRAIPMRNQVVDVIICDMPFGRRSGSYKQNAKLYPLFINQILRVLRPGGRIILLTLQKKLLSRVLQSKQLVGRVRLRECTPCYMGGLELILYSLEYLLNPSPSLS